MRIGRTEGKVGKINYNVLDCMDFIIIIYLFCFQGAILNVVVLLLFLHLEFSLCDETDADKKPRRPPKFPNKWKTLYTLMSDYLNNSKIFTTTVDFTVPLFSFKFPTEEDASDSTALVKQNIVGQFLYFVVVAISFIASILVPVLLNEKNENGSSRAS